VEFAQHLRNVLLTLREDILRLDNEKKKKDEKLRADLLLNGKT
jgi:hypothetical protein